MTVSELSEKSGTSADNAVGINICSMAAGLPKLNARMS